jgi:hypothetical protein
LIHHSDAGSQYTSIAFAETLVLEGIAPSIGSVGDAYDNALAETTIGLFKTEAVGRRSPFLAGPLRTIDDVKYATVAWVDWYNNRRLHSLLNSVPPDEYENGYAQTLASEPETSQPWSRHQTRDGSLRDPQHVGLPAVVLSGDQVDLVIGSTIWKSRRNCGTLESYTRSATAPIISADGVHGRSGTESCETIRVAGR